MGERIGRLSTLQELNLSASSFADFPAQARTSQRRAPYTLSAALAQRCCGATKRPLSAVLAHRRRRRAAARAPACCPLQVSRLTGLRILYLHDLTIGDGQGGAHPQLGEWQALSPLCGLEFLSISANELEELPPAVVGMPALQVGRACGDGQRPACMQHARVGWPLPAPCATQRRPLRRPCRRCTLRETSFLSCRWAHTWAAFRSCSSTGTRRWPAQRRCAQPPS